MGDSTGNYGLDVDNDALEDTAAAEDFTRPFAPEDEATIRAPSPLPSLPAPDSIEFETGLSIAEQFEYVKPILAAVLDDARTTMAIWQLGNCTHRPRSSRAQPS